MAGRDDSVSERTVTVAGTATQPAGPGGGREAGVELPTIDPAAYKIAGEHGRGGLGRVLRARDRRLDREVAIKELLDLGPEARARFEREARITARLQHPGIVPIYEAGRWPSGEPFYAMKLVSGQPLSELIRRADGLPARLGLLGSMIAVADAVAYAHGEGVIHRDLKPANVMVGEFGETVVIDWGIAKALSEPDGDGAAVAAGRGLDQTVAGSVVGTPAYMAPEQACGEPVDERADVFALGAMMFHLLAGRPPRPAAVAPGEDIGVVAADVPADLIALTRQAMAFEPGARYRTASALAADLRRYQTGQLVSAHRYSVAGVLRKWVGRHRAAVAVAAVGVVVVAALAAVSVQRVLGERAAAQRARGVAEQRGGEATARANRLVLAQAEALLERDPTRALAWIGTYPDGGVDGARAAAVAQDAVSRGVAREIWTPGRSIVLDVASHGAAVAAATKSDGVHLRDADGHSRRFEGATLVRWSADGRWLAYGAAGGGVAVHDLVADAPRGVQGAGQPIYDLAFSADGALVAARTEDGDALLWDLAADQAERLAPGGLVGLTFAPHGRLLAGYGEDGAVHLWDLAGAARTARTIVAHTEAIWDATFSPDGRRLATATGGGAVAVLDVARGVVVDRAQLAAAVSSVAYSADGAWLAIGTADGGVRVRAASGGDVRVLASLPEAVSRLRFAPAGALLAVGSEAGALRLFDLASGGERTLVGHREAITELRFTGDGATLLSGSADRTVRRWDIVAALPHQFGGHGTQIADVEALGDEGVAWIESGGGLWTWRFAEPAPRRRHAAGERLTDLHVVAGGTRLVTGGADGTVRVVDVADDVRVAAHDVHQARIRQVRASADGTRVVSVDEAGAAWWFAPPAPPRALAAGATVSFGMPAADGAAAAVLLDDGTVAIVDRDGARHDVGAHPGSRRVAVIAGRAEVASLDGGGGLRRAAAGRRWEIVRASATARGVDLSEDGRHAAIAIAASRVDLVDVVTGATRAIELPRGQVRRVVFDAAGRFLMVHGDDGAVTVVEVATGRTARLSPDVAAYWDVVVTATGVAVAVLADGALRELPDIFGAGAPTVPAALRAWCAARTRVTVDAEDATW